MTSPDSGDQYVRVSEVEQLVGVLLRRELATMLKLNEQQPSNLLDTNPAAVALGYPSAKALSDARKRGTFRLGIEVFDRSTPTAKKRIYQYDIEKCRERIKALTKKKGSDRA